MSSVLRGDRALRGEVLWAEVARRTDSHDYMSGVERTVERVAATGEVFTPTALVVEILRSQPLEVFGPGRSVIDPACGDGQFLVAVKWAKVLAYEMPEELAVADLYGVDLMRDNVDVCKRRLGGGTILMGNILLPRLRLDGQTDHEHRRMVELFGQTAPSRRVPGVPGDRSSSSVTRREV